MINSYNDFLEFIFTPISYFVDWLSMVSNSLLHNYFFITILGLTIFVSLFWLLHDSIFDFIHHKINEYEDYNDKYNDYATYQKIQREYYDRNRLDIFEFKYDKYCMSQQIIISFLERNKQLLTDYKVQNLKLNKMATYQYLVNNNDIESAIDYHNYRLHKVVAHDYLKSYHDYEVEHRLLNRELNDEVSAFHSLKGDRIHRINNIKKIIKDNNSIVPPEPEWFDKVIDYQPLTADEQEEMNNLINNF